MIRCDAISNASDFRVPKINRCRIFAECRFCRKFKSFDTSSSISTMLCSSSWWRQIGHLSEFCLGLFIHARMHSRWKMCRHSRSPTSIPVSLQIEHSRPSSLDDAILELWALWAIFLCWIWKIIEWTNFIRLRSKSKSAHEVKIRIIRTVPPFSLEFMGLED